MPSATTRRATLAGALLAAVLPPVAIGATAEETDTVPPSTATPFTIDVPSETLSRIMHRVRECQWPPVSRGAGWQYGVDADWFRALVGYWRDAYDWRAAEAALNATPQFTADIEGHPVYFAHRRAATGPAGRLPILLLHGWPYSFATLLPLADRLADAGYEVVVPSLPGSGFSAPPDDRVRGLRYIARRIDALMTDVLGHGRYLVHGGDHGAVVADWLAIDTPSHIAGIHANMIAFRHHGAGFGSGQTGVPDATPEETAYAQAEVETMERESAYFRLQLTRPETIAYALADSPVGWAAYMLDKWQKWTDERERPFDAIYGRDRLLTEVMLTLVSESAVTSIWPYAGFATEPFGLEPGQTIDVPFGYSSFDTPLLPRMSRAFAQRARTDIRLWREHEGGGHFPMLQAPDVLAADLQDFAATVS